MGFINQVHEPPFFLGVNRPVTERTIIPSTWSANGAGIFGTLGETFEYSAYAITSLRADRFDDEGIREGRQNGSKSLAEDLAFTGRLEWRPDGLPGLLLGASAFLGNTGQDLEGVAGSLPSALLTMAELHAQYRHGPFHARALLAYSHLDEAGHLNRALGRDLNAPIAQHMLGGYAEVAYDIFPWLFESGEKSLEPFLRVEYVDPQLGVPDGFRRNANESQWVFTPGINFHPHPNVVLKAEYRRFEPREGDRADEVSVGMGFAF